MKYKLPEGCVGVVHAGAVLSIAKDGTVAADAAAASELAAHGIVPAPSAAATSKPGDTPR